MELEKKWNNFIYILSSFETKKKKKNIFKEVRIKKGCPKKQERLSG
jgi:hypothetical protein